MQNIVVIAVDKRQNTTGGRTVRINGCTPGEIIEVVEEALDQIRPILDAEGIKKEAGYFVLRDRHTPGAEITLLARIGVIPDPKKSALYYFCALEKGERLFANLTRHVSSWQSRNERDNKWGGAILAEMNILSFSGLPELADEAIMLDTAVVLGWLAEEQADEIANISDNHYYRNMIADA